jgi:hypothetical protein
MYVDRAVDLECRARRVRGGASVFCVVGFRPTCFRFLTADNDRNRYHDCYFAETYLHLKLREVTSVHRNKALGLKEHWDMCSKIGRLGQG